MKIPMKVPTGTVTTPYLRPRRAPGHIGAARTPGVLGPADARTVRGPGCAAEGTPLAGAAVPTGRPTRRQTRLRSTSVSSKPRSPGW